MGTYTRLCECVVIVSIITMLCENVAIYVYVCMACCMPRVVWQSEIINDTSTISYVTLQHTGHTQYRIVDYRCNYRNTNVKIASIN